MAVGTSVWVPTSASGGIENVTKVAALGAGTSSAEISLGNRQLFMITAFAASVPAATANINVKFGPTGLSAAAATDMGLPISGPTNAIAPLIFETGDEFASIRIFNNSAVAVDIYVCKLARI